LAEKWNPRGVSSFLRSHPLFSGVRVNRLQEVNLTLGEHHKVVKTGNEVKAEIDVWIQVSTYICISIYGALYIWTIINFMLHFMFTGDYVKALPLFKVVELI
jgi:hypothetical protein